MLRCQCSSVCMSVTEVNWRNIATARPSCFTGVVIFVTDYCIFVFVDRLLIIIYVMLSDVNHQQTSFIFFTF